MSVIRNPIPILEFDSSMQAVLQPKHEKLDIALPEKCVFPFLGELVDQYAEKVNASRIAVFESITKNYPVYIINHHGEEIALCQAPAGAPAAVQLMDWLIGYGAKKIISAGSCGTLVPLPEGHFLIPTRALRDEGTSYHYAPPSRFMDVDNVVRQAIAACLAEREIMYHEVISWSTDGFFRETKEKLEYRKSEGCSVVEMECSALAACAAFRGAHWGEILFTADSLADTDNYMERNWAKESRALALSLCFDSVIKL